MRKPKVFYQKRAVFFVEVFRFKQRLPVLQVDLERFGHGSAFFHDVWAEEQRPVERDC